MPNAKLLIAINQRIARLLPTFALSTVLTACGNSALEFNIAETRSLSGVFKGVSAPGSLQASTFTCSNWNANLYSIDSNGTHSASPIATAPVNASTGFYEFSNLRQVGVPKDLAASDTRYLVRIAGCDQSFERFVTDRRDQDVSSASDVVSLAFKMLAAENKTLADVNINKLTEVVNGLAPHATKTRNDAFTALRTDPALSSAFASAFGFSANKLGYLPPTVTLTPIAAPNEATTVNYGVTVHHWNLAYQTAVEWYLDSNLIGSALNGTISLNKNSQGSHVLKLVFGSRALDGTPDEDHIIDEAVVNLNVADTFPAIAPAISLVGSANRNFLSGTMTLNTGVTLENCDTFSALAVTYDSLVPPLASSAYTLTCATAPTQIESFLLSGSDGAKTVALWARDSNGNISATPSTISLTLDRVAPTVSLPNLAVVIGAGSTLGVSWSATDSGSGLQEVRLQYAADGSTYTDLIDLTAASSPWTWTVPSTDRTAAKLKLIATDRAGNSQAVETAAFAIDSTAPSITIASPASMTPVKTGVTLAGVCETGLPISLSGAGLSSPTSATCTAGAYSVAITFTTGDGTKTIVATQTDSVGLTGSATRDFVRDNVAPVLVVSSPADNAPTKSAITLTGTCEVGGSNVVVSGDLTASASVSCSGAGTYNSGALTLSGADGTKTITIAQNDTAGNTGSIQWHAVKDNVGPLLLKLTPADNSSFPSGTSITGTCESGHIVTASGTGLSATATDLCISNAFSLSVTFSAGDGTKAISLSQPDTAGNTTTLLFNLIRDSANPVLTITSPAALTPAQTGVTLSGTCEGTLSIALSGSGLSTPSSTSCASGSYSVVTTFTAGEGNKTITLSQTDAAGNVGSISRDFVRDQTPPNLTVTSPADGTTAQASLVLTGACETGLPINFGGTGINAAYSSTCSAGTYSQTVFLKTDADGTKQITVSQTDAAGNATTITRNFARDNAAPLVTQTMRSFPYYVKVNTASFGGACENGLGLTIKLNGTNEGSATCSSGAWSYTVAAQTADGTYNYTAHQTDAAGNEATAAFRLIRDTVAPSLAITAGANQLTASNSITISGTCEAGLPNAIAVSGSGSGTVSCNSGSWTYTTPSETSDATRTYTFTLTDQATNATTVSTTWERNTNVPNLLITTPGPIIGKVDTATIAGNCESGLSIEVRVAGTLENTIACSGTTFSYTTNAQTTDADRAIVLKQTNALNLNTTASISWVRDNVPPILASAQMSLNSGASTTANSQVRVALNATDALTNITHFCLKTDDTAVPSAAASCWISVSSPAVGLTPNKTLSLSNYRFNIPITPGSYTVYAWTKDAAGNISALSASGAGTSGQDKSGITLVAPVPPTVNYAIASSTDSPASPQSMSDLTVGAGNPIYIKWKASDNNMLPSAAVRILFTSDDSTYTLVASGLTNGANGSCTVNSPFSTADDDATGCYRINASPASGYIKFRVIVTDSDQLEGGASTLPLNVADKLKFLAGNTDPGLNLSAQRAMFFYRRMANDMFSPDAQTLAVTRNGTVFFKDAVRGILKVDPADGIVRVFVSMTGTSTGDNGPATSATVRYVNKITLDHQQPVQRLWIFDYNRIRRVDLETNIITTVIGGGSDNSDIVNAPLNARIDPYNYDYEAWDSRSMFFAAPNGDFYFQAANDGYFDSDARIATGKLRIRRLDTASNQIQTWRPNQATQSSAVASGNYNDCQVRPITFSYDPSTSTIVDRISLLRIYPGWTYCNTFGDSGGFISFDANGLTMPASTFPKTLHSGMSAVGWQTDRIRFHNGLDGRIYAFGKEDQANGIFRYEGAPTYNWTRLLGNASDPRPGNCPDNTDALSCKTYTADIFVTENGTVYFLDDGMIRTISASGKVITLMGQAQTSGVGEPSLQARLGTNIMYFQVRSDSGVAFADAVHHKFYEFDPNGSLFHIAGNGNYGSATMNVDARTTGNNLEWPYSTGDAFAMDPSSGEIYHHSGNWQISKLVRTTASIGSSGMWQRLVGGGTNAWSAPSANGTNNIFFYGDMSYGLTDTANYRDPRSYYGPKTLGYGNGKLFTPHGNVSNRRSDSAEYPFDNMIKLYSTVDGTQTHLAGKNGLNTGNPFDDISSLGTLLSSAELWSPSGLRYSAAVNVTSDRWLFVRYAHASWRNVYDVSPGGTLNSLATLSLSPKNISYRKFGSTEFIYYCAAEGEKIYRRNIQSGTEVALPWPITGMKCVGATMQYRDTTQSLIFAYKLNGLMGFAEYLDPM